MNDPDVDVCTPPADWQPTPGFIPPVDDDSVIEPEDY